MYEVYESCFEEYRARLFVESPKAAYLLESMIYGLMAQIDGLNEKDALEIVCRIIAKVKK